MRVTNECETGLLISVENIGSCTNPYITLDRVKRIWYLSPMRAAKVQASLRIRAVSPEPSLLAHNKQWVKSNLQTESRIWMAGHAQLKFVMTECSKTQIRLTGLTFMLLTTCNAVPYSNAVPYNIDLDWMACPVDCTHNIIHLSQNCFPAADSFFWAISIVDLPLVWYL